MLFSLLLLPVVFSSNLVLVSFDGFRYDTLNETIAPTIANWAKEGVWYTKGVKSQAVTFTAPNHLSIVTGLYEEQHGIIGNVFFDVLRKEFYDIYNLSSLPGVTELSQRSYWYPSETIWQTNGKAGGKSTVMHWPVGDVHDKETHFVAWHDHGDLPNWQKEADGVVDALQNGSNFVAWYVSEPDHTLHGHGFFHDGRYRSVMGKLDRLFGYFLDKLKERNLLDTTDIILTADHGHSEIRSLDWVLCMDRFIEGRIGVDYQVSDHSVISYTPEHAQSVFDSLSKAVKEKKIPVKVIWTKDVPSSWHFSHPSRLGQVMVVPDVGADARFMCKWKPDAPFHSSTHGQAPEKAEMRAVLAMAGPSFTKAKNISTIPENIDLFPLMAYLLHLTPPPHNGSIVPFVEALSNPPELNLFDNRDWLSTAISVFLLILPLFVLTLTLGYLFLRLRQRRRLPMPLKDNDLPAATAPFI